MTVTGPWLAGSWEHRMWQACCRGREERFEMGATRPRLAVGGRQVPDSTHDGRRWSAVINVV